MLSIGILPDIFSQLGCVFTVFLQGFDEGVGDVPGSAFGIGEEENFNAHREIDQGPGGEFSPASFTSDAGGWQDGKTQTGGDQALDHFQVGVFHNRLPGNAALCKTGLKELS